MRYERENKKKRKRERKKEKKKKREGGWVGVRVLVVLPEVTIFNLGIVLFNFINNFFLIYK